MSLKRFLFASVYAAATVWILIVCFLFLPMNRRGRSPRSQLLYTQEKKKKKDAPERDENNRRPRRSCRWFASGEEAFSFSVFVVDICGHIPAFSKHTQRLS